MEDNIDLGKHINPDSNIVAVCGFCRHHGHSPMIEFNFGDSKVYWLCSACKKMNSMDFSKPLPPAYPRTKRM